MVDLPAPVVPIITVVDFESSPIDIKRSNYSNLFCTSQDCYYLNNSDYELC